MTLGKLNEKCNWNIFTVSVSVLEDLNNCTKNLFIIPQNEIMGTPLVHLCSRAFLHVPAFLFEGSPKYCDEYVCLSVCPRGYLQNNTGDLYHFLCVLPVSVARSSSGTLTIGSIAYRREGVFFRIKNALSAGKGDGNVQRGRRLLSTIALYINAN